MSSLSLCVSVLKNRPDQRTGKALLWLVAIVALVGTIIVLLMDESESVISRQELDIGNNPVPIGYRLRYDDADILPRSATDYFRQNCWMGVSQPGPDDAAAVEADVDLDEHRHRREGHRDRDGARGRP